MFDPFIGLLRLGRRRRILAKLVHRYLLREVVVILCTTKLVMTLTLHGYVIVPTLLDWIIGVLFAAT